MKVSKLLFIGIVASVFFVFSSYSFAGEVYSPQSGEFQIEFPSEYAESLSKLENDTLGTVGSVGQNSMYFLKYGLPVTKMPKDVRGKFLQEVKQAEVADAEILNEQLYQSDTFDALRFEVNYGKDSEYQKKFFKIIVSEKFWLVMSVNQMSSESLSPETINQFMDSVKVNQPATDQNNS